MGEKLLIPLMYIRKSYVRSSTQEMIPYIYTYIIWQMPLSTDTYIYLMYTTEQLRALLKSPAAGAWQCWNLKSQPSDQLSNILIQDRAEWPQMAG